MRSDIVDVMSDSGLDVIKSCDVIKSGCDVIYITYDYIHIVEVMSYIPWV